MKKRVLLAFTFIVLFAFGVGALFVRKELLTPYPNSAPSGIVEIPRGFRDDPSAERVRISEELRQVQARLSAHEAWVKLESETVGTAYTELIYEMRKIAGGAMRQAWTDKPAASDAEVNIPPETVDLSPLKPFEKAYMDAVAAHLGALAPWWSK